MRNGKLRMLVTAVAVVLLLGGALALALVGPYVSGAQAQAATAAPSAGTPGASGGLRTLTTGTVEPPATAEAAAATAEPVATAMPVATATGPITRSVPPPTAAAVEVTPTITVTVAPTISTPSGPVQPLPAGQMGTITVIGEGRTSVQPDTAHATVGVEVVSSTVKAATAQAQQLMTAVLEALKSQGIAEKDIQTSGFNIFAERNFTPDASKPGTTELVRYHVSNNVAVTIHDMTKVSSVLDAVIEAGANNIYGVTFTLADAIQAESQAYNGAMADALRRAKYLAGLAGVRLGPVYSISEVVGRQVIIPSRETAVGAGMGGGGGPVQPGELEVNRQLEVSYYIQ